MSLQLYMDENVQGPITRGLRRRHVDVLRAQDDGHGALDDDDLLLTRATALGRVLFAQDADLLSKAVARQRRGQAFSGLIYAHQSLPARVCIGDLEIIASASELQDVENLIIYLPL